ncbi:hypothetical protein COCON_G00003940 [Conger conger]|uniref:Ig-like domain-containing protein n=1 Tax=Conger conger TaxID=82655 RepID=A0A9Q1E169_CONCO|nr:hypothetical protein COCON_G00003940 [Conger conger]
MNLLNWKAEERARLRRIENEVRHEWNRERLLKEAQERRTQKKIAMLVRKSANQNKKLLENIKTSEDVAKQELIKNKPTQQKAVGEPSATEITQAAASPVAKPRKQWAYRSTVLTVVESQAVSVDPQVTAYLGGEVTLRCQFSRGDTAAKVVQVTWEKQLVHFAVFNPFFGKSYGESPLKGRVSFTGSSVNDASINITNVNETDEGTYVCKYSTHPGGTIEGTTTVTVRALAEQQNNAAVLSVGTTLLLIVLIPAAVYFIVMKCRQRYQAPTCSSSSSRGDQAARVAGDEDEEVQYADIRRCLPAQRGPVPLQSSGATEYAAVNYSTHPGPPVLHAGAGEPTYAQVSRS